MEFNDQSKLHRLLATWLIRLKFIKQIPLDLAIVNEEVAPHLPVSFPINIPGGKGELTIDEVELRIDDKTDVIYADILSHFKVTVAGNIIYKVYLQLLLDGRFEYNKAEKMIAPKDVKVRFMQLLSDKRSVLKDTRSMIIDMIPEPMKTVMISTVITADMVLKTFGVNELAKYLSLYLNGNKQRILDYHHEDIENRIVDYMDSGALDYHLDESIFEQQLFAEYGQETTVKDGQLLFVFHTNT